jgi:hypothetical protein
MNIGTAAIEVFRAAKQPMSSKAVAEGLNRGGFRHTSKNFINTVNFNLVNDPLPIPVTL